MDCLFGFSIWLRRWDTYRTIFIFLVLDTIQAELQFMYFFYVEINNTRSAFLMNQLDTIKSSNKYGFDQFPSYDIIQCYFIVAGALFSRMAFNWVLFDGITTGIKSHVEAGLIGTVCTTLYIVVGGIVFWIKQYNYFHLPWYYLAIALTTFIAYSVISGGIVYILWHDKHKGAIQKYSKHLSASLLLFCGLFVGFLQFQLLIWFVAVVWYNPLDAKFSPLTHRFPVGQ